MLKRLPANRYAVVRIAGPVPESIHHAWCYLWQTYFLENRLTHTGATDLEAYGPGDPNAPSELVRKGALMSFRTLLRWC
ncbi:hypothetical protein HCZ95_03675 [Limosilactobacillus fermentum]